MRKYMKITLVLVFILTLTACGKGVKKVEEKTFIEEEMEEKKEGEKNLVRNEDMEEVVKNMVKKTIAIDEHTSYQLVKSEVWTYKEDEKKVADAHISLKLENQNKEEVDKIIDEASENIEKELGSKYGYEKLEIIWETPQYKDKDIKEIIYFK